MHSVCRSVVFFVLLTVARSGCCQEPSEECPPPDKLQSKYAGGSIYLTFIPLNDLTQLLNDDAKFEALCQRPPGRDVLVVFRNFLNQHRSSTMNEALAFLQLNLIAKTAGYKEMSDRDGTIKVPSWSEDELNGIGCLCDRFFHEMLTYNQAYLALHSGRMPLTKGWSELRGLQANAYIPGRRVANLSRELNLQLKRRTNELNDIRQQNPKIYEAMNRFREMYEYEVNEVNREAQRDEWLRMYMSNQRTAQDVLKRAARYEQKKDLLATRVFMESSENRELPARRQAQLEESMESQPLLFLLEAERTPLQPVGGDSDDR